MKIKKLLIVGLVCFTLGLILNYNAQASSYPSVFYNSEKGENLWVSDYQGNSSVKMSQVRDPEKGKVIRIYDAPSWYDGTFSLQGYDPIYECDIRYRGNRDGCMGVNMQYKLNFSVKTEQDFTVRVYVKGSKSNTLVDKRNFEYYAYRILEYKPTDEGYSEYPWSYDERKWFSDPYYAGKNFDDNSNCAGNFLRKGLGSNIIDGQWHDVSIDLAGDLSMHDINNNLVKIDKIEIFGGDVYLSDVYFDFRGEELKTYDIDSGLNSSWSYDTGWLDTHEFGDSSDKVSCSGGGELQDGGLIDDSCDEDAPVVDYTACTYAHKSAYAEISLDLKDLPRDKMSCDLTINNEYTYNDFNDKQFYENLLIEAESSGGIKTSQVIYDAGEGWHQITTSKPLIFEKGINKVTFKPAGWCSSGQSVHFGFCSAAFGSRDQGKCGNKAFRIKCEPTEDAIDLNFSVMPEKIEKNQMATLSWESKNAAECIPTAGYTDLNEKNDWQSMRSIWSDLKKNPDGTVNINWPDYGVSFLTNNLPYSVSYGLGCYDELGRSYLKKSLVVNTYSLKNDSLADCQNYEWSSITDSAYYRKPFHLTTGKNYRLYLKHKGPFVYADKFILTNDSTFNPKGTLGNTDVAIGKTKLEIEAENYDYINSWSFLKNNDYTASNEMVMKIESEESLSRENNSSYIAYDFSLSNSGVAVSDSGKKCYSTDVEYTTFDSRATYHNRTYVIEGASMLSLFEPGFQVGRVVNLGVREGGFIDVGAFVQYNNGAQAGYFKLYEWPTSGKIDDVVAIDGRSGVPVSSWRLGDYRGFFEEYDNHLNDLQSTADLAKSQGKTILFFGHAEDSDSSIHADGRIEDRNKDGVFDWIDTFDLGFLVYGKEVACENVNESDDYYLWGRSGRDNDSEDSSFWIALDVNPESTYHKDLQKISTDYTTQIREWSFNSAPINNCSGFDFWIGDEEGERSSFYGKEVIVGDSINVWWEAKNINFCIASGEDNWGGLKSSSNLPLIHGDSVTPLSEGNKFYYLECFDDKGFSFGKKEVRLTAVSGFNVAIDGKCGRPKIASDGPIKSMSCSAGILLDPPGISKDEVNRRWNWTCEGLSGGSDASCSVKDLAGWIEK